MYLHMYTCLYCHPASDQSASQVLIPNYISIIFIISCCYFLVDMWRFKELQFSLKQVWAVTWDFQQCGMCDQQSLRPACAYAESVQSLCKSLKYSISVKLLTEHHLEFLGLKGGCTCSSESTLVKRPHSLKSHVTAQLLRLCRTVAKW